MSFGTGAVCYMLNDSSLRTIRALLNMNEAGIGYLWLSCGTGSKHQVGCIATIDLADSCALGDGQLDDSVIVNRKYSV